MTDSTPTVTAAAEALWRATRDLLRAVAADPETEALLLARLDAAHEVGVMVAITPQPRIGLAGADADGRFCQVFELRALSELN